MNPDTRFMKLFILAICTLLASSSCRQFDVSRTQEMEQHLSVSTIMNEEMDFSNAPSETMPPFSLIENHPPFCIYPPLAPKPPSPTPTPPFSRPPPPLYSEPQHSVWCVAKPTVPSSSIQVALDYACGSGAECGPIRVNGLCYQPDTVLAHASYAFNSYWQRTKRAGGTCDFGGLAMFVTVDPSYDQCHFAYN